MGITGRHAQRAVERRAGGHSTHDLSENVGSAKLYQILHREEALRIRPARVGRGKGQNPIDLSKRDHVVGQNRPRHAHRLPDLPLPGEPHRKPLIEPSRRAIRPQNPSEHHVRDLVRDDFLQASSPPDRIPKDHRRSPGECTRGAPFGNRPVGQRIELLPGRGEEHADPASRRDV